MKYIYVFFFALAGITAAAQVSDIVSLGSGYANQVWYSLENDEQGTAAKAEWDIAFSISTYSSSIHLNSANGLMLWTYPLGDITSWDDDLDISGIDSWTPMYDSEISWGVGAFDQNAVSSSQVDFGWGVYNPVNHFVVGDSLFVIQLSDQTYRKLKIVELSLSGVYSFSYAELDGSNEVSATLTKSDYAGKNFGYYSLLNGQALDREPVSAGWDLLFTQYTDFIPTAYTVAGILHNGHVQVAQVDDVDQDTFEDFGSAAFVPAINEIGYDWKAFGGMSFVVDEDRVYFVQENGNIWKLVFTAFGGSSNGNYEFTKELVGTVSVDENEHAQNSFFSVYPNPSTDGRFQLLSSLNEGSDLQLAVRDMQGRLVHQDRMICAGGLTVQSFELDLPSGLYLASLQDESGIIGVVKLQIQR